MLVKVYLILCFIFAKKYINMKKITLILFLLFVSLGFSQTVVINELDSDTTFEGNNIDNHEFVELLSETPNFSLDGYVLVFLMDQAQETTLATIPLTWMATQQMLTDYF